MLIFIDVETSGLNCNLHGILSIGAVPEGYTRKDYYRDSFYAEYHLPKDKTYTEQALSVNGFYKNHLYSMDKENEWTALMGRDDFVDWLKTYNTKIQFVGWNVSFDRMFLETCMFLNGMPDLIDYHWLDVMSMFAFRYDIISPRMSKACEIFGIEKESEIHNALSGAKKVAEIYNMLKG